MIFKKKVPDEPGYYWVVDTSYADPFVAYVQIDHWYPFIVHMWKTCYHEEQWIGEHKYYRFGDQIIKPDCKTNKVEQ